MRRRNNRPDAPECATETGLRDVIEARAVTAHFQPIVALDSRTTVAVEALSRGPQNSPFEDPAELFGAARRYDLVEELDSVCWTNSLDAARTVGFAHAYSVFVNVEPDSLRHLHDDPVRGLGAPYVIEVTERALMTNPASLVRAVRRAKDIGHRIALDDLGSNPASLALLPLIDPDVVKIDMRLVRNAPDRDAAQIMSTIATLAEKGRAVVLAEGIESEQHALTALALGATHGQGWLFGRPDARPRYAENTRGLSLEDRSWPAGEATKTPFDIASAERPVRTSTGGLLFEMSAFLETRARESGDSAVVLATLRDAPASAGFRHRVQRLGQSAGLVVAFSREGEFLPDEAAVRSVRLPDDDPLLKEWNLVVLTSDYAAALTARQVGPDAGSGQQSYSFVLTHDRDLTVRVARNLLDRLDA